MRQRRGRCGVSRSNYSDDIHDYWQWICWRGAVNSAIKGRRGQAFLKEMLQALDSLPEHKLIAGELEADGAVCAIGAVGKARAIDMTGLDPEDTEAVVGVFGIADSLAREIVYENDEGGYGDTPEERYIRMRAWVAEKIHKP